MKKKSIEKEEKIEKSRTHTWGTWAPQPRRTETVMCVCGNKYIKTRKNQTTCVWCICNKSSGAQPARQIKPARAVQK